MLTGWEGGENPARSADFTAASCPPLRYHRWSHLLQRRVEAGPVQRRAPERRRSGLRLWDPNWDRREQGQAWDQPRAESRITRSVALLTSSEVVSSSFTLPHSKPFEGLILLSSQWVGVVCLLGEDTAHHYPPSPLCGPPRLPAAALAKHVEPSRTRTTALTSFFPVRLKPIEETSSSLQSLMPFGWFSCLVFHPANT